MDLAHDLDEVFGVAGFVGLERDPSIALRDEDGRQVIAGLSRRGLPAGVDVRRCHVAGREASVEWGIEPHVQGSGYHAQSEDLLDPVEYALVGEQLGTASHARDHDAMQFVTWSRCKEPTDPVVGSRTGWDGRRAEGASR